MPSTRRFRGSGTVPSDPAADLIESAWSNRIRKIQLGFRMSEEIPLTRRLLFAVFALELALGAAVGVYFLFPAEGVVVGRLVNTVYGSLPFVLFCGLMAVLLAVFLAGKTRTSPPVQTEESRNLETLERAVETSPSPYNFFQLARFCQKTSRYPAAVEAYRRVLDTEPARIPALYGYGICLFRAGQLEAAIRSLEEVMEKDPTHDYGQIEIRLAEAYLRAQQPQRALETLDLRQSSLGVAEYHFLRGQALEKLGHRAEARNQHLLVLEAAATSPAHRKEKDRHLAQLARQFLLSQADQPST